MLNNLNSYKEVKLPSSFPIDCTDALEVVGDSMEPTIVDGAIAGVDFDDTEFEHNHIFIVRLKSGRLLIKRLRETPHGIAAISDNSIKFPVFYVKPEQIFGRVKWVFNEYN